MGRTFLRQDTQIYNSDVYDDTLSAGSTLESAPTNIETDLNGARSQLKRAIWADTAGNWYDDIQTVNGKKRALTQLNTDLDDIEEKRVLFRMVKQTPDVTVSASNNFAVLSVSSGEAPTETAAVGAGTAEGAVVALLAGTSGTHSLNLVSGPNALAPKNLVIIRDATTGQALQSGGEDIFGLLQAESIVVDGDAFDDTTKQAQISFVISNAGRTALVACPVADIEGKTVNYAYVRRVKFDNLPEYAFLTGAFVDETSASEITLDRAIDNQSGAATQVQNIDWTIADTFTLDFQDSPGTRDLLSIKPNVAGDEIELNIDDLDINNVNRADFLNGVRFDSGGTAIDVGDVAGTISSAGLLALLSGGSSDLRLNAASEFDLIDGNKSGSTYAGQLKLSDTSQEWSDFETAYNGEVSILRALYLAKSSRTKTVAVVTAASIAADVNVTGAGGSPNIDAQFPDYTSKNFLTDLNIYLNGQLLRNGANSGANHDVYPGTSTADGDLKFEFPLKGGSKPDVITVEIF